MESTRESLDVAAHAGALRTAEVNATKAMIDRVEDRFGPMQKPKRLPIG